MEHDIEEFNRKYKFNWFCMQDGMERDRGVGLEQEGVGQFMVVSQNEWGVISIPVQVGAKDGYMRQMEREGISILKETPVHTPFITDTLRKLNFTTITELLREGRERDRPFYQAIAYRAYPTLCKNILDSAYKW